VSGWIWVEPSIVLALHDEHLAEHGGLAGIRDQSALESALTRPANKEIYEDADAATLAAAYAFGIARNHPFADGNKRTSFIVAELFLALNGFALTALSAECVTMFLELAAGVITEDELASWFREHIDQVAD
jgi:death-on-curing protein